MHHVLLVKMVLLVFGGRRECAVVGGDDEDEGVGYGKPKLGVLKESWEGEVKNIEDANINKYREEKG